MRLPAASLVVLVGPSGAGKSHWARANFRPEQIVSSDALRALVGTAEHDQRAGADAFEVLNLALERRSARGLMTVVDTLGLDSRLRTGYVALAHRHGLACHAVIFDTPAEVCRTRNRGRADAVPTKALSAQLTARDQAVVDIDHEGFDGVHSGAETAEVVATTLLSAGDRTLSSSAPRPLHFGLQLSSFAASGDRDFAAGLAEVVTVAEAVGFESIWVMDHVVQIPQVGRKWDDMPESWTTLAWLAALTRTVRLGTLVSGVSLRTPAHLAKIVATLDVLSGGRAVCGVGVGWWEYEHRLYGWNFAPLAERYALLEDTLRLLPVMWGPGSPPFEGKLVSMSETICYPRPVQDRIPILVGGSGERMTLKLAGRYADACNLFGDPATVSHKVDVLAGHCRDAGRDPGDVAVTHLSTAVVARTRREMRATVERLRNGPATIEAVIDRFNAGTVDDHIALYRDLAAAGVQTAIVALPDVAVPGALEAFGDVIAAFR